MRPMQFWREDGLLANEFQVAEVSIDRRVHGVLVKVRVGVGLGAQTTLHGPELGEFVDEVERLRFDKPVALRADHGRGPRSGCCPVLCGRSHTRLKFGMSVLVLPGRNPIVVAKELATLAIMSGGQLLPAFGLGVADGMRAPGVRRRARSVPSGSTRRSS